MSASPLEDIEACMLFPLTPALSLGEREKPLPFRVNTGAKGILQRGRFDPLSPRERDRVRGKETSIQHRCQIAMSASPLEEIEACRVFCVLFPLTPALSLGEREKPLPFRVNTGAKGILPRGRFDPLSPRERDRVRGKGTSPNFSFSIETGDCISCV